VSLGGVGRMKLGGCIINELGEIKKAGLGAGIFK
jgi:4-hydroxy-3-methylbut-2-en-1-yl diphosphate synthase IspG/GcpE